MTDIETLERLSPLHEALLGIRTTELPSRRRHRTELESLQLSRMHSDMLVNVVEDDVFIMLQFTGELHHSEVEHPYLMNLKRELRNFLDGDWSDENPSIYRINHSIYLQRNDFTESLVETVLNSSARCYLPDELDFQLRLLRTLDAWRRF